MTGTTSTEPTAWSEPSDPSDPSDSSANPVYVPGYGWVSWPRALLDAQARYLTFIHRPDRAPLTQRMYRWLRRGGPGTTAGDRPDGSLCVFCGLEWLCPEAAWARGWLSPMARLRGRCRPRHRARRRRAPRLPTVSRGVARSRGTGRRSIEQAMS